MWRLQFSKQIMLWRSSFSFVVFSKIFTNFVINRRSIHLQVNTVWLLNGFSFVYEMSNKSFAVLRIRNEGSCGKAKKWGVQYLTCTRLTFQHLFVKSIWQDSVVIIRVSQNLIENNFDLQVSTYHCTCVRIKLKLVVAQKYFITSTLSYAWDSNSVPHAFYLALDTYYALSKRSKKQA